MTPQSIRILMSHKFFVNCMSNQGLGFARESQVQAELVGELFWCETA